MLRVADVLELRRPNGPCILVDVDQVIVDVSTNSDPDEVLLKPAVFTVPLAWPEFVRVAAMLVPGLTEEGLKGIVREQMSRVADQVCR